jgi:hypothetical protein
VDFLDDHFFGSGAKGSTLTIMNEVAFATKDSIVGIRDVAGDLAHPQRIRVRSNSTNLDLSTGELDKKQYNEPL